MTNREIQKENGGKNSYPQIDALKGIAIFLVILGHGIIYFPVDLHQIPACASLFGWLSSVHMPLFFVVSGYCFSYRGNYRAFIRKKLRRLAVPYLAFNLLDLLPRALLPAFFNRPRSFGESLKEIALSGGEFWFLYVLFIIFLVYPALYRLLQRRLPLSLGLFAINLGLYLYLPDDITLFCCSKLVRYLLYFTLGVYVKHFAGTELFEKQPSSIFSAVAAAAFFGLWIWLLRSHLPCRGDIAALAGILTLYFCTCFEPVVKAFAPFGRVSLQLYLCNGYALGVSRTVIVSILGVTSPAGIIAFNVLVDYFIVYLVVRFVCTRLRPVRFLMGMTE